MVQNRQEKSLSVVLMDRLEVYLGNALPAWMVAEQQGCIAVFNRGGFWECQSNSV